MTEKKEIAEVLAKLESEEQLASLQYLVEKLPTFVDSLKVAEDKLAFVTASMQDDRSLKMIAAETEEKIERLHIDESHINAMMDLVQLLPRLAPIVQQLDNVMSFAQSVWGDKRTVDQLLTTTKETVNLYVPIDKGQEIIEETKEEFARTKDSAPISVFGLMKMIKDPVVQDGLKMAQAFLTVANKHR